jgi:hypothetical protein
VTRCLNYGDGQDALAAFMSNCCAVSFRNEALEMLLQDKALDVR